MPGTLGVLGSRGGAPAACRRMHARGPLVCRVRGVQRGSGLPGCPEACRRGGVAGVVRATSRKEFVLGPVSLMAWPKEDHEAVLWEKATSRQLLRLGFGEPANLSPELCLCHQSMEQGRGGDREGRREGTGWVGWPHLRVTRMSKALSLEPARPVWGTLSRSK